MPNDIRKCELMNQGRIKELCPYQKTETFVLGYILGVLKGDGSIKKFVGKESGSIRFHYLRLTTIDLDFAVFFQAAIERWSGKSAFIKEEFKPDYPKPLFRVQYCSARACEYLFALDYTQLTTSIAKIGFLKGFFDSEGWTTVRSITMSNTNKELLELLKKWLLEFKITPTIHAGVKHKGEWRLSINKKPDRVQFFELVGGCTIKRKRKYEYIPSYNYAEMEVM